MAGTEAAVAIYWDFENVHACVLDDARGKNAYHKSMWEPQDAVVDIARVTEYAATLGRVVVHRAYANWRSFFRYKDGLQAHAIDTVQLFPLTGTKNGADIRLALDAAEDLRSYPHITHVVVVSSDSDYTALAQRCRTYGRRFVGIGTARIARGYPPACDDFRRYHDLPASPGFVPPEIPAAAVPVLAAVPAPDGLPAPDGTALERAAALVIAAVRRLAADSGEPWVLKAAVRPMVKRLDPAFDESALGFAAFTDLVAALGGGLAERGGKFDHELAVRADVVDTADEAVTPASAASRLEAEFRQKKQRVPADRRLLWAGPGLITEIFAAAPDGIEPSFDSLGLKLEAAAAAAGMAVSEADFKKLKTILWRSYAFELLGHDQGIRLRIPDPAQLRLRAVTMLLSLLTDPDGIPVDVLAEAVFGPAGPPAHQDVVREALAALAEHPQTHAVPHPDEPAGWESAA